MTLRPVLLAIPALAALLLTVPEGRAAGTQARQYYSSWDYNNSSDYYYRHYYYKPAPTYTEYHYHYVIYYPSQPTYYYYYNPHKEVYWGRTPVNRDKPVYSLLKQEDRKKELKDIPESAFPEPSAPPPIPESEDGQAMELPPADPPA